MRRVDRALRRAMLQNGFNGKSAIGRGALDPPLRVECARDKIPIFLFHADLSFSAEPRRKSLRGAVRIIGMIKCLTNRRLVIP